MDQDILDQLDQLQRGARDLDRHHPSSAQYQDGHNRGYQPQRAVVDNMQQVHEHGYFDEPMQLDSFDEQLLRQPDHDSRQWQAAQGHARLSLPPTAASSIASQGYPHRAFSVQESTLQQPDLLHFAFNAAGSTSPGHLDRLSSPAYSASQRHPAPYEDATTQSSHQNQGHANKARPAQARPPLAQQSNQQPSDSEVFPQRPMPPTKRSIPVLTTVAPRASHAGTPIVQGIQLISTRELPDRFRALFNFPLFNAVQSQCFPVIFRTNDNFVLSSPTGSGKTAILELAICRLVHGFTNGSFKIVYMAPTKSLCSERVRDWQAKFGTLDLQCAELTGDTDHTQLRNVQHASIIVTTPEKWDSMTRKWKDHQKLMQMVRLFLIDEVHILKEDRGPTLEAVVSRMKSVGSDVRFIALSATVPNSQDIATWLGKDAMNPHIPAPRERFGEEFRPVRLQKHVCGYQSGSNDFAFERLLDSRLTEIIATYSQRKPLMVFCMTRKSCVATARLLADWWSSAKGAQDKYWSAPRGRIAVTDRDLRDTIASGVAYHHAGMSLEDRAAVEQGYLAGEINVICCTSTLAVGVNLPCHMVVIKGTVSYTNGAGVKEYSDLETMQMLGRAGRPQFDDSAVAVIMTRLHRVTFYENMMAGSEVLESCLHEHLIDHLNAEIGLGSVTNASSAKKWLAGTFLYVRLKENPEHYKLEGEAQGRTLDERLERICQQGIALLEQHDLVRGNPALKCSELGDSMARYYIQFDTMKLFSALKRKAKISEILSVISQAAEFKDIRFRAGEKSFYKDLNKKSSIKFPIPVNIDLTAHKVSLIIQSVLGAIDVPTEEVKHRHEYIANKAVIFQHAPRLIRCIIDCQLYFEDSVSARNALMLARSFGAQVWDDSPLHMRQLVGIGLVGVRKLVAAGLTSIEDLANTETGRIEKTLTRNPPFGSEIQQRAMAFPQLRISLKLIGDPIVKKGEGVSVKVKAEIGLLNDKVPDFFNYRPIYICLLVDTSNGRKAYFVRMSAKRVGKGQELPFHVSLASHGQVIRGYVMCDEIAGTQRQAILKPDIPAFMFPSPKAQEEDRQLSSHVNAPNTSKRRTSTATATRSGDADDEFGDAGVDDATLAAAEWINIEDFDNDGNEKQQAKKTTPKQKAAFERPESVQLPNGRWTCNHACINKNTCKHGACCHEGLEKKPRPAKPKEAKKTDQPADPRQTQLNLSKTKQQPTTACAPPLPVQRSVQSKEARDLDKLHNSIKTTTKDVPLLKDSGNGARGASYSKFVTAKRLDSEDFGISAFNSDDAAQDQGSSTVQVEPRDAAPKLMYTDQDVEDDMLDMADEVDAIRPIASADKLMGRREGGDMVGSYLSNKNSEGGMSPLTLPKLDLADPYPRNGDSAGGMSPLASLEGDINKSMASASNTNIKSALFAETSPETFDDDPTLISGALQDTTTALPSKRNPASTELDDASQFLPKRPKLSSRHLSGMELRSEERATAARQPMMVEDNDPFAQIAGISKPEAKVTEEESIDEWFEKNLGTEYFQLV